MKREVFKLQPSDMLQLVGEHFPELKVKTHSVNTDGWDHAVLIINDAVVFRFPLDNDYRKQLQKEITILQRLTPLLSARIPHYTYVPQDNRFAGYTMLPGQQVTPEVYESFSAADQKEYIRQIAEFLSQLHSQPLAEFSDIPRWLLEEDQPDLRNNVQKLLTTKLTAKELERVHSILDMVDVLLAAPPTKVFIHNDLYSSHLLWDAPNKQLGVIDFSDMCSGDPAVDFNELYEYGPAFVEAVYELYQGPKDVTFLERAWIYQQWTGVFLLADHFINDKTTWAEARVIFDKTA